MGTSESPLALWERVEELVGELVKGDYAWVERRTGGRRLSAAELRRVIEEYPGALGHLTTAGPEDHTVIRVLTADVPTFAVDVVLGDAEGRRSDLTLQLTVVDAGGPHHRPCQIPSG